MKYFIGYLIEGEAAIWHIETAKSVSDKFNTWKLHEKLPPHITISYLAEVVEIGQVKEFLKNWAENKKSHGNFTIRDFDRFDDMVVFAKVETDGLVRNLADELVGKLKGVSGVIQQNYPVWHPHATLANRLTPEEINKIWEYVQTIQKPNFILPFNNVTIFRYDDDMKWVVEETFKLGKI